MDYQWDFSGLWQYRGLFLQGLAYTVGFTIITVLGHIRWNGFCSGQAFRQQDYHRPHHDGR